MVTQQTVWGKEYLLEQLIDCHEETTVKQGLRALKIPTALVLGYASPVVMIQLYHAIGISECLGLDERDGTVLLAEFNEHRSCKYGSFFEMYSDPNGWTLDDNDFFKEKMVKAECKLPHTSAT